MEKPEWREKPIDVLDHDPYGVRLFKVEPAGNNKVRLTISACAKNACTHVSVSIELERGAWIEVVSAVREIYDG